MRASHFPAIPATVKHIERSAVSKHERPIVEHQFPNDRPFASAILSAWALILSLYLDNDEIVIVSGLAESDGDRLCTFPTRFQISNEQCTTDLCNIATDAISTARRQESIDQGLELFPPSLLVAAEASCDQAGFDSVHKWPGCALLLHCTQRVDRISINAKFDPQVAHPDFVSRLLHQVCYLAAQIGSAEVSIAQMDLVDEQDRSDLSLWNSSVAPDSSTIHQLALCHVASHGNAPALDAWDGSMSYSEMEACTSRIAFHLVDLGIGSGDYVPILYEKSLWAQVAMLAVLRTGAAFVPLSPEHPHSRTKLICDKICARFALASPAFVGVLQDQVSHIVVLTENFVDSLTVPDEMPPFIFQPEAPAYILYTSGSTGQPKGAVIQHRSLVAAALGVIGKTNMHRRTRTLQFGSYIFGAAMIEIWSTLIAGGCVCVPSDEQRLSGLQHFVHDRRVDWAFMTPSLARLHSASGLSNLRTLSTGGETVTPDLLSEWASHVSLYTVYGSAEQSHIIAMDGPMQATQNGSSVGNMFPGSSAWIVKSDNPDQLLPLCCTGELITEGPQTALGYFKDTERTADAFPESFPWRTQFARNGGTSTRLYRTGDIVRYLPNGRLEFISRREGYVKLRGQRLELGEIEYHIRQKLPQQCTVCVEVVVPRDRSPSDAVLIAFLGMGDACVDQEDRPPPLPCPATMRRTCEILRQLASHLESQLPSYMVPRYYMPLHHLPLTVSGKTARKELQKLAAALSPQQLLTLSPLTTRMVPTQSNHENYMQRLWARVLNMPTTVIRADHTFFDVGGDSLKAITLLQHLRRDGYDLMLRQLMADPKLSSMASLCDNTEATGEQDQESC